MKKKTIVVTGGSGRFGKILKGIKNQNKILFPTKKELDILNEKKISNYFLKIKPDILIHLAGLSRPMKEHYHNIEKSINPNVLENSCLLCSEHEPHHCHRRLVVEYLNENSSLDLRVKHLF